MNHCVIRVAQIGVGYWGPNLLRNLIANSRCEVKLVADLSIERREFAKSLQKSIETTDCLEKIYTNSEIDAVIVATPVATHFPIVCKLLQSRKHVLVEKPMAQSVNEVEEINRLSVANNKVAMVGHTFLFNSAVRYLKKLIDDGDLGEIRYIYSQRLNLGRIRSDVDALWNLAPHDVSIFQYLLNDPKPIRVNKHGMDFIQPGIDDVVFVTITYPNKIIGHIHVSWLDPNKIRRITVVGSKKMVVYDDIADDKISIYDKGIDGKAKLGENMDYDLVGFPEFNHRIGDILLPKISFVEPLKNEINHFFDCIEGKASCLTGPSHAKEVIGILEAASK